MSDVTTYRLYRRFFLAPNFSHYILQCNYVCFRYSATLLVRTVFSCCITPCNISVSDLVFCSFFFLQATQEVLTRVPEATNEEMLAAVAAAKEAFPAWSKTSIMTRQGIMFRLQNLIKENMVWHWSAVVISTFGSSLVPCWSRCPGQEG